MRACILAPFSLICVCLVSESAQADTGTFKLKHISATRLLRFLGAAPNAERIDKTHPIVRRALLPEGIDEITTRNAGRVLFAQGTPNALKDLQDIVSLLD